MVNQKINHSMDENILGKMSGFIQSISSAIERFLNRLCNLSIIELCYNYEKIWKKDGNTNSRNWKQQEMMIHFRLYVVSSAFSRLFSTVTCIER